MGWGFWAFAGTTPLAAQASDNPFELAYRLRQPLAIDPAIQANPFELLVRPQAGSPTVAPVPTQRNPLKIRLSLAERYAYFQFGLITGMLLLLALLITFVRGQINKILQAFFSDNWLNQFYREQSARGLTPLLLLYGFFFLNAGIFAFLVFRHLGVELPWPLYWQFLVLAGIFAGTFLLKHAILRLIGFVFPIDKECNRYAFVIVLFAAIIGLVLTPFNLLLAYGPNYLHIYLIYFCLAAVAVLYLLRSLRSLTIANRFLAFHQFHFLLYICTVEIAPVLVGLKIVTNVL